MNKDLYNDIMGYFFQKQQRPNLKNMRKPHELLLAELIASDTPVPVPVDYALNVVFTELSIDEFCETFHLNYEIVTYRSKDGVIIPRAFYEFSFKDE
jgi:hypothetical protein